MALVGLTEAARGAKLKWLLRRLDESGVGYAYHEYAPGVRGKVQRVFVNEEDLGIVLGIWTEEIEDLPDNDMEFNNDI